MPQTRAKRSRGDETEKEDAGLCGRVIPAPADYLDVEELRIEVLRQTVAALSTQSRREQYHKKASANLARWSKAAAAPPPPSILVKSGDWGAVALAVTKQYGQIFACLNMANAHVPGGGYVEGMPAQEENMFRRTDCHFSIVRAEHLMSDDEDDVERYTPEKSALLNAEHGRVYLDKDSPRVCLRGAEDRRRRAAK